MSAEEQATDELRAKLNELKLETVDDLTFQANYKKWAEELRDFGCDVAFLKAEWKRARAKRAAQLKTPRAKSDDPWAAAEFTLLGVRGEDIYFHDRITNQVIVGPPTKQRLLQLGDEGFFYDIAPSGKEGRIDWDGVISKVSWRAKQEGVFDASRIRGRGAWLDEIAGVQNLVLNCGDHLLVDGMALPLGRSSSHVYVSGVAINIKLPAPLTVDGTEPIRALLGALRWRNLSLDPLLLRGFIAVAPVAGALSWRPHLWLTGASQNGKTTLRQYLIEPLTPFRFTPAFGAHSTEAGIRQSLGGDSLLWTLDESEPEASGSNVRKILAMLRSNSSSSFEERTVKGTTHGKPLAFTLRSSALMCSVLVSAEDAADVSRVTVVELVKSSPDEYQIEIEPRWGAITPQLGLALFSRTLHQFSALLNNIETFKVECSKRADSLRGGDQLGTLLAGAYLMEYDGVATRDEVARWLDERVTNWGEHAIAARGGDGGDEQRCLNAILGVHVDVNVEAEIYHSDNGESARVRTVRDKRTLAELVDIARGAAQDAVTRDDAEHILARFGLRVEPGGRKLWIANRNDVLAQALARYPWGNHSWLVLLRRLPGASYPDHGQRFAGVLQRYTSLPLDACAHCRALVSVNSAVCQHCGAALAEEESPF
jgi:putative DNA primase/helicase